MSNQPYSLPGQQAPFSQEAEEAVIGAVLVNSENFLTVASFLQPEDFYIIRNQYMWEAMQRISERNEPIDYLTLQDELRAANRLNDVGGPAYITHLINSVPTSVHAEIYGRLVERAAIRRRLLIAGDEIKALALDEETAIEKVTTDAEARLFKVTERNIRRDVVTLREALGDYFERVENIMQYGTSPGLPTGFRDVDTLLGGMQKSDLMIFAGRPGMGKCVAAGTMIPTERGYLPIEQLKPQGVTGINDDEGGIFYPLDVAVLTPEGAKQASHFYDSGSRPTRRMTTRAGYSLTATYSHPVLTLSPQGEKVWKPMAELESGDYVVVQHDASQSEWTPITHLEDAGIQHCYDLTVPDGHAFVANGIVSHNTSFLLSVTSNAAKYNGRIAIFSMEMGADQIVQRLISMETGINSQRLRLGQLNQQEWNRFVQATGRMGNLKIFIDDSPALTPLQLRTKCRRLVHEYGLDLIVVDYLQLMNAGSGYENNRVQEISYISRSLKELARELNVPVFTAAQLSRAVEQRQDKRPQLSDLRESGCLAGDTLVYLPDTGEMTSIRDLVGKQDFNILALNTETWKLEATPVSRAFSTGVKPTYMLRTKLGRTIRATANHKFLTICGWKRLDELTLDDCIALPNQVMSETQLTHQQVYASAKLPKPQRLVDVYWDAIAAIEPDGETDVYDLTVPQWSNFVANNIIVHNSIEQDADIVMFLYRDIVYNEATEFPNRADVIVAKHRNGPTGVISLHFENSLTKFTDAKTQTIDLTAL